jgi:hypothetical protein
MSTRSGCARTAHRSQCVSLFLTLNATGPKRGNRAAELNQKEGGATSTYTPCYVLRCPRATSGVSVEASARPTSKRPGMKLLAPLALAALFISCSSAPSPQSGSHLATKDRSLPHWGESEEHFEHRMGDRHAQRPDGTSFPRDYRMMVGGRAANVHPIFGALPGGKTILQSSRVNTGRSGTPLSSIVAHAFLASVLPKDARRISATGNGPVILKDAAARAGETNIFFESPSFARTVPQKTTCSEVRPGIFLVYSEGDHGAGPSSIQVFSEYLSECYMSTPMKQT